MSQSAKALRSIDVAELPKHFDAAEAERRWDAAWQRSGVYHYDAARPRSETFVIDTPPPTVSGSLHIGHVFSYTQTDLVARYKRMRGFNIYYPMGWDDNGLPTERRVQNYYHVRCDPGTAYEPGLELAESNAKQRKKPARLVSRRNFIEICQQLTKLDEQIYMELWRRIGLSIDWRFEYATIDEHCRRMAQLSFRDLFEKGHVYTEYAPSMWDCDFQTPVAQAEVQDREIPGHYHRIEFGLEGEGEARGFSIATTRPELLAACVGVTAHPEDERYRGLFGKRALTPLFRVPVPIFASELADPEKGTGVLMVCTFGDATDVLWWREQRLAVRQIVGRNGRLEPIAFGGDDFPSLDPEAADRAYAALAGLPVAKARRAVVELLRDPAASACAGGAPLQGEPEPIQHPVKFYENGDRPLEYIPTRQWFARLLDKKAELVAKGEAIEWHPAFMGARYRDWTENLQLDWNVSRQRYFGVSIPVWYPLDAQGERDYGSPIVALPEQLPVDTALDTPPGYAETQRDQPGGFSAETDIFDTWFTSSMSPQIASHWKLDPERHAKLFPADVRPQSHEIIRTWAFYTIAKALLHEDSVPWRHVLVSGWILDPDRRKMSKSKGNVVTPMALLDRYTADAARYWAASARLGSDTAFDEKVWKIGKRLVTKIFNASKFVLSQTAAEQPISAELDRAFLNKLRALVERSTASYESWNYAQALQETESFFWSHFTDTYIELSKARARSERPEDAVARGSAVAALRLGLSVLLRLLAPVLPYITEEVWSWLFADETGHPSIHRAPWPGDADWEGVAAPDGAHSFDLAVAALAAINKAKADAEVSMGREVERLVLAANEVTAARLAPVLEDVLGAARCRSHRLEVRTALEDGQFEVAEIGFAPKPA